MTKKVDPEQFGYDVTIEKSCEHSERSDEPYGPWSASYTNLISDYITTAENWPGVTSIHKLEPGDIAYVVWVEWSAGDSFGWGERSYTEVIGLFTDESVAYELQRALYSHYKTYMDIDSGKVKSKVKRPEAYDITTSDGQNFKHGYASWCGYFERLDEVSVSRVEMVEQ
jgi:hypothetical protein